ncbi:MAG: DUF1016 N-terminal domain-containing protein [Bacteroidota bacterium]
MSRSKACQRPDAVGSGSVRYFTNYFSTNQKSQTLSGQLSWNYYVELLKVENELERNFYLKQSEQGK